MGWGHERVSAASEEGLAVLRLASGPEPRSPPAPQYQTECISGCVCPEGLIDDGRGGCVVEEACPCVHNSDLYLPGDKIRVDCNTW